jgi:hypothetical protein
MTATQQLRDALCGWSRINGGGGRDGRILDDVMPRSFFITVV